VSCGIIFLSSQTGTYFIRSLAAAISAKSENESKQKYRFLNNYFKDLPPELDEYLKNLTHVVSCTRKQTLTQAP